MMGKVSDTRRIISPELLEELRKAYLRWPSGVGDPSDNLCILFSEAVYTHSQGISITMDEAALMATMVKPIYDEFMNNVGKILQNHRHEKIPGLVLERVLEFIVLMVLEHDVPSHTGVKSQLELQHRNFAPGMLTSLVDVVQSCFPHVSRNYVSIGVLMLTRNHAIGREKVSELPLGYRMSSESLILCADGALNDHQQTSSTLGQELVQKASGLLLETLKSPGVYQNFNGQNVAIIDPITGNGMALHDMLNAEFMMKMNVSPKTWSIYMSDAVKRIVDPIFPYSRKGKIMAKYTVGDAIDCLEQNLGLIKAKPSTVVLFLISPQPCNESNYEMTLITELIEKSMQTGRKSYIVIVGDITTGADGSVGLSMFLDRESRIRLIRRSALEVKRKSSAETLIISQAYNSCFPSPPELIYGNDFLIRELFVFETCVV